MRIRLNGNPYDAEDGLTMAALLARLGIVGEHVAVARNGRVVRKGEVPRTVIAAGDEIEVIHAVAGG